MQRSPLAMLVLVLAALAGAGAGCGGSSSPDVPKDVAPAAQPSNGAAPWPAPPNPLELTRKAGLVPEPEEHLEYHVHAHLDVFVNGKPVQVPAGIGIDIHDPAVHHVKLSDGTDAYGGIAPPCDQPCISPLHTHDVTGILHTESATQTPNTLGEFFTEWKVKLDDKCVGGYCEPGTSVLIFVDGDRYTDDPDAIELRNHREIAIVIGTPPASIPSSFDFG